MYILRCLYKRCSIVVPLYVGIIETCVLVRYNSAFSTLRVFCADVLMIAGSMFKHYHLCSRVRCQVFLRRNICSLLQKWPPHLSPQKQFRSPHLCQPCCKTSSGLQRYYEQTIRNCGFWSSLSSSGNKELPTLKTIEDVAKFIKERTHNILVMVGAGISTASGIPDFRSPGTGLYDNLQKYNLPYPEAIFDINFFMMDPRPFFTLAQDLYPGVNYKPNETHHFLRLLHEEEKLQMVYTQNIDGLERLAGIPDAKLMESHGTFASASCTLCYKMHDAKKVKQAILDGDIPVMCESNSCKGKVKPDIVFFGENLPEPFWNYHNYIHFTDLLLVIGTSLEARDKRPVSLASLVGDFEFSPLRPAPASVSKGRH
ncbi:NAD-dependent protein deacetylase sirtuin-3-like isoform X2 [Panulirus ornatus]|uniref:NAD-dependent protein deacetylase sirtuin-3-like isoform X2 n=1 Tax=Panulirus ornatus TaxID=150431 RepID=UPI003A867E10